LLWLFLCLLYYYNNFKRIVLKANLTFLHENKIQLTIVITKKALIVQGFFVITRSNYFFTTLNRLTPSSDLTVTK